MKKQQQAAKSGKIKIKEDIVLTPKNNNELTIK
jgi:hypothetical protein